MRMFFSPARYNDDKVRARYLEDILERVRAIPGVQAAGSAHFLLMTGTISGSCFTRKDRPEPAPGTAPTADFLIVSPQYFSVMGIGLVRGRDFNARDGIGADVRSTEAAIIVNDRFAAAFFHGEDPIGKRLRLCWNVAQGVIVGVVADARHKDLAVAPSPTI